MSQSDSGERETNELDQSVGAAVFEVFENSDSSEESGVSDEELDRTVLHATDSSDSEVIDIPVIEMATSNNNELSMVCKLNADNYPAWRTQIRLVLRNQELWEVVDGSDKFSDYASEDEKKKWKKRDLKAHTLLVGTLTQDQVLTVQHCDTNVSYNSSRWRIH